MDSTIASVKLKSNFDFIRLLKNIALLDWQWTKNLSGTGIIFFQAIYSTTFFIILFSLLVRHIILPISDGLTITTTITNSIDVTYVRIAKITITWITAVFVNYWHMDMRFGRKWNYACDLYNKVIFFDATDKSNKKEILRTNLAIDLLQTDLWAKKTFQMEFYQVLKEAIEETCGKSVEATLKKMNNGKLLEDDALDILEVYLKCLKTSNRS